MQQELEMRAIVYSMTDDGYSCYSSCRAVRLSIELK